MFFVSPITATSSVCISFPKTTFFEIMITFFFEMRRRVV